MSDPWMSRNADGSIDLSFLVVLVYVSLSLFYVNWVINLGRTILPSSAPLWKAFIYIPLGFLGWFVGAYIFITISSAFGRWFHRVVAGRRNTR